MNTVQLSYVLSIRSNSVMAGPQTSKRTYLFCFEVVNDVEDSEGKSQGQDSLFNRLVYCVCDCCAICNINLTFILIAIRCIAITLQNAIKTLRGRVLNGRVRVRTRVFRIVRCEEQSSTMWMSMQLLLSAYLTHLLRAELYHNLIICTFLNNFNTRLFSKLEQVSLFSRSPKNGRLRSSAFHRLEVNNHPNHFLLSVFVSNKIVNTQAFLFELRRVLERENRIR